MVFQTSRDIAGLGGNYAAAIPYNEVNEDQIDGTLMGWGKCANVSLFFTQNKQNFIIILLPRSPFHSHFRCMFSRIRKNITTFLKKQLVPSNNLLHCASTHINRISILGACCVLVVRVL